MTTHRSLAAALWLLAGAAAFAVATSWMSQAQSGKVSPWALVAFFWGAAGVSVAIPVLRSHFTGPGMGRSGGSTSDGPIHRCTPCTTPSVMHTTSVRITRSRLGVMMLSACPARTVSPMADSMVIRCGFRRRKLLVGTRFLVREPCATTAG